MDIIGYLRRIDLYDNRFHILISSRIIGITTIGVIRIFASGGVRIVRITASSFKMRFQFGIPGNLIYKSFLHRDSVSFNKPSGKPISIIRRCDQFQRTVKLVITGSESDKTLGSIIRDFDLIRDWIEIGDKRLVHDCGMQIGLFSRHGPVIDRPSLKLIAFVCLCYKFCILSIIDLYGTGSNSSRLFRIDQSC